MKVSFFDLTEKQQANYGNGCGLTLWFLSVPNFMFEASCAQHDFNYARGGGLYYKLKADIDFWAAMVRDAEYTRFPLFWTVVATLYFFGVTFIPLSYLAFSWGRWRTKKEILLKDKLSKK